MPDHRLVSDMCLPTLLPWFLLEAPDAAIAVDPLP
jgi:hypothetical protein